MNRSWVSQYVLIGKIPRPEPDIIQWGKWFEKNNRHVADTMVGDVRVSTVFLALDHNFGSGRPLLFETMTFGDDIEHQERYSTWEEAEMGHKKYVKMLEELEGK